MKNKQSQSQRRARKTSAPSRARTNKRAVLRKSEWSDLESVLGHSFRNNMTLRQALTHSSYAYEQKPDADGAKYPHNEQMEFLGDAVLGFLTARALYDHFPSFREGQLSRARTQLVRAEYLAEVGRKWGLGKWIQLGRGEERSHGHEKNAILADTVEAIIAAIYLDGGTTAAEQCVMKHIVEPGLHLLIPETSTGLMQNDPKSELQERMQATSGPSPAYQVIKVHGPDHHPVYEVAVHLRRRIEQAPYLSAHGSGSSKKQAEQNAAMEALARMNEPAKV